MIVYFFFTHGFKIFRESTVVAEQLIVGPWYVRSVVQHTTLLNQYTLFLHIFQLKIHVYIIMIPKKKNWIFFFQ